MQIAICDDNAQHLALAAAQVQEIMKDFGGAILRPFSSATELLQQIKTDYKPDAAILDIHMKELDGISLAKEINAALPHCSVIFLTAHLQYAPSAYDADHIYFVMKSQIRERLPEALRRAKDRFGKVSEQTILVQNRCVVQRIPIGEVLYLERVLRKTRIVTLDGEYFTAKKPEELLINAEGRFIRCHQSYYVNPIHVLLLNDNGFLLKRDIMIPVSRSYKQSAKQKLLFGTDPKAAPF